MQLGWFFGRLLGLLLKTSLPLVKNVLKPLTKSVLIPLGLIKVASATDAEFKRKFLDQGQQYFNFQMKIWIITWK